MDALNPPTQITGYETFQGLSEGNVSVGDGATLVIAGEHVGAINVEGGGTLVVSGSLTGPLTIESLATATVGGLVKGAVDIKIAGTLIVEQSGRVDGDASNFGSYVNRGTRTGRVEGRNPDDGSAPA